MILANRNNKLIVFFCFLLLSPVVNGQVAKGEKDDMFVSQVIEMIAEDLENENLDYSTLFDELSYFYNQPIDLNKASKDELEQLYFLTQLQIKNLLDHRENNGKLLSLYELQSVAGFDLTLINRLILFSQIKKDFNTPNIRFAEVLKNGKHEILFRYHQVLEDQAGFLPIDSQDLAASPNSRYLGSKPKLYSRYRFKYSNKVSVGVTAEKDQGEEFFTGSQPNGFDFYSGHLFLQGFGKLKRVALGDYQLQFGQGLSCWTGLGFGKSSEVIAIKKNPQSIRPYTSVGENAFMRGGAATVTVKDFDITAFYSNKNADANISESDTLLDEIIEISSLQQSGFHSTPSELEDKDAVNEQLFGGNVTYRSGWARVGLTAVKSSYSVPLNRSLSTYNQFEFVGQGNSVLGADYSFILQNFNFFGEISSSKNGGMAFLSGMIVSLDPRLSLSALYRKYEPGYQNLYGHGFGENTKNNNEEGLYLGVEAKINNKWKLSGYYDRFQFPWLKYKVDAPSIGSEWLAQLTFRHSKKLQMYFRYRNEQKMENAPEDILGIDYLTARERKYLRYNISYKISDGFRTRTRMEVSQYGLGDRDPEKGYLLYQDLLYKAAAFPLSISFRFALFDTETYNARIYAYENDVLYSYSIPAYYYKGTRTYCLIKYTIARKFDIWRRYSQTYYDNRYEIGSGLNQINGSIKSEIKAQVRYKF